MGHWGRAASDDHLDLEGNLVSSHWFLVDLKLYFHRWFFVISIIFTFQNAQQVRKFSMGHWRGAASDDHLDLGGNSSSNRWSHRRCRQRHLPSCHSQSQFLSNYTYLLMNIIYLIINLSHAFWLPNSNIILFTNPLLSKYPTKSQNWEEEKTGYRISNSKIVKIYGSLISGRFEAQGLLP